jgi:ethanolamine ammonia-lyase small subunit
MAKVNNRISINEKSWHSLREFTAARIALGRTGNSIPLNELLNFKLAHAHARDAVYSKLNIARITKRMETLELPVLHLHSQASNRQKYLKRPDYGRKLNKESIQQIADHKIAKVDIAIVIADGLSASAVNSYAANLLKLLVPKLLKINLTLAPICFTEQGRVAIADEVGQAFRSKLSLILIGERPGLSSADSMGAYLTYSPKIGLTDESRNCISNIRPNGLPLKAAADKLFYLIIEALKRNLTGVDLKDNQGLLNK